MSSLRKIINPSNGQAIAKIAMAGKKEALEAIESACKAFRNPAWRNISLAERREFLLKISKAILGQAKELAELESLNSGKPIKETTFMDIPSSAKAFQYFADNLEKYLKEEPVDNLENAQAKLIREPQGVVLLIVPWNYPLLIASWKLAQALAAGNTVILKPSSLTPLTALKLADIVKACGLPEGVVNVLAGSGQELGEIICRDERVNMISFTGSNSVGRDILGYTTGNVKKTIMELGGKSAAIVLEDADLELAVNGSLCSIFLNQGQMCTAMSRIFIQENIYDSFLESFLAKTKQIKLGDSLDFEAQIGPLISNSQREMVLGFVHEAQKQGAKLLCGGKIPKSQELEKGFFFEPTVFTEVNPQSKIFQEEAFGPVACVNKFSSIDQAKELANNSSFGLAACIWAKDTEKASKLAGQINAGTVWINTYGMFFNELPYGGFNQSGFGKELGKEGFLEYTRLKNIVMDDTKDAKPIVNYWYGF